ncbi:cytochrome c biogenesis protein CcdA [Halovulum dunhuangense]|uniref:Cytochrome c biogenesis protein CcdA n=1 Tax=Halovulum dunhuangense TaxID=1505036 RepID=A0A849L791_9RHOB|nr:cytochrome c biogenesis protein CcdA [Halovulum dunhuangense]NNU81937.1 cytochrome c biogenesis protein CcdA [Halovulum dunhuangense]
MFGIDVMDGSLLPALFVALVAGVISFLSPCVLPIVPPYLAYMAGTSLEAGQDPGRKPRGMDPRVVTAAAFFVLGLSTVFLMLGVAASALGSALLSWQREMAIVAGVIITLFGLHFLGILRIPILYRDARIDAGDRGGSAFGAYVMGLAFAFGWTPCIGPILGMILSLVIQDATLSRGIAMMGVYALGLGLPFLLAAVFLDRFMGAMGRLRRHMGRIEKATGLLLVVVGVMMATGLFSAFSFWLLETFPVLGLVG